MWWHAHGNWSGWWSLAWVCWILFIWGGLATLAVFAVRRWRRWRPSSGGRSPEDILAERYARGEISTEEYRERLAVLKDNNPG
jgi:putative membrane protein